MKILITGAGGFIGQYLVRELSDHDVCALTKQQLNLSDATAVHQHFESAKYDTVIHCGAAGRNAPMAEDWSIVANNLASILNLMSHKNKFEQLINIGTGAEFDVSQPIDEVRENDIFTRNPKQSYGMSKNIITRYLVEQPNCFTLRLFGCFDSSEDDRRLLPRIHSTVGSGNRFDLQDRFFDMISAKDFVAIVRAVLTKQVTAQNINCVYAKKHKLSEILNVFCDKHKLDKSLINISGQGLNYTGNGDTLAGYNLNLEGLEQALTNYRI